MPLLYFFLSDMLLLLSSCRREGVRSALPGLRGLLGVRLPVDVPVAPCSASESFIIFVLRFRCIRYFVINVINNIRIRFIMSFSWYVLWYTIHSVVYTCNTWFIKGHKPSNHIRARIKSHVYTTEWTVYHSTYHVKRYNKMSTNVIYSINDKMSDTNMRKCRTSTKLSLKLGATGTSTGRRPPRSPRTPGGSKWTPRRRELSSSRVSPKRTRGKE